MASSRSSVIQFNDGQDAQSELQFQDFTQRTNSTGVATLSPSESYTTFPDSTDLGDAETEDLLGEERKQTSSFWEFSYYQSFFDVDTDQVLRRLLWSMVPMPGRSTFLDRHIRPNPDLYGPFWIAATLVFSTAICANIASYLMSEGQDSKAWSYDFHKVSLAATAIYSYVFLLPMILWGLMWYRQSSNRYTLLEVLCVYGYSLAIYVPISVLWVIQVAWLQWILVIVGAALSGTVLLQTFWPIFRDENKKIAAVVLCLILLFHTLLAVGFVMYFFHPSNEIKPSTVSPVAKIVEDAIKTPQTPLATATEVKNKVSRSTESKVDPVKLPNILSDQNNNKISSEQGESIVINKTTNVITKSDGSNGSELEKQVKEDPGVTILKHVPSVKT